MRWLSRKNAGEVTLLIVLLILAFLAVVVHLGR